MYSFEILFLAGESATNTIDDEPDQYRDHMVAQKKIE